MNVVPDMLPELKPTFDLRIKYAEAPPKDNYLRTRVKRKLKQVEPGIFLVAEQVCPRLSTRSAVANRFHGTCRPGDRPSYP